jgi:hypothetical protein
MSTPESRSLVRFHSAQLEGMGYELNQAIACDDFQRAAEMLPGVKDKVQLVAGHIARLLTHKKQAVNKAKR